MTHRWLQAKQTLGAVVSAVVVLVLALAAASNTSPPLVAQTQTRPGPPPRPARDGLPGAVNSAESATGTATIRGRVVAADTGNPLRRALVRITSSEMRGGRMVSTDAEGRFEIAELAAGRYTVTASKAGFVSLSLGQRRPFERGRPVELGEGRVFDRASFSLPRGSVVTGRVVDEFGDPIADAVVSTHRYRFQNGERRLTTVGRLDRTDDIGQFRVFGLSPGEYYLTATFRQFGRGRGSAIESADETGYAPTYYPGTPNLAEAQRLTLALGQELLVGEFGLMPTRTARVSGTAVDSLGDPLGRGQVVLRPNTGVPVFGARSGRVESDGTFTIPNVPPGEYLLQAFTGGRDTRPEFASLPIVVVGDDVPGIHLMTVPGGTATGRVIFATGTIPNLSPSTIRLTAVSTEPTVGRFRRDASPPVQDDWSFTLENIAAASLFRVSRPPKGWTLEAVLLNGRDVTDTPVAPRGGRPGTPPSIDGLEVVLTDRVTEVSGVVTDADGEVATDCTVVVFARDRDRWGTRSRFLGSARPDQDGRFQVRALPPGDYLAVALDVLEEGEWQDPELLARLVPLATGLRLGAGTVETLQLSLSMRP